jgi:hypothetical protein
LLGIVPPVMRRVLSVHLVVAAVAALAAAAAATGATGRSVSLTLVGTHPKSSAKCGDAHADPYSAVGRGAAFNLVGSVRPVPAKLGWRVRVVVKRCIKSHYTKVWTGMATGRKGGTFRIAYTPRSAGLFIAVADYGTNPNVSSRKVRLHVR